MLLKRFLPTASKAPAVDDSTQVSYPVPVPAAETETSGRSQPDMSIVFRFEGKAFLGVITEVYLGNVWVIPLEYCVKCSTRTHKGGQVWQYTGEIRILEVPPRRHCSSVAKPGGRPDLF